MTKYIAHRRKDGKEQSLEDHLTEVGGIAARLSQKINVSEAGDLLGLLHDFGKYSKLFQNYINSATGVVNPDEDEYVDFRGLKGKIDHSTAGAQFIWQQCQKWGKQGELVGQIMSLCIASHHSGLIDCLAPDGTNVFGKRMQKPDEKTHFNECLENVPKGLSNKIYNHTCKELIVSVVQQLSRITRTDKNLPHNSLIQNYNIGFFTKMLFSCLIDADRMNSADFENPDNRQFRADGVVDWSIAVERTEAFLSQLKGVKEIDKIRREISENCRRRALQDTGIYSLTVPTGGGKTYASLRFALHHARKHGMGRIIYIIPYTSIIEQNAVAIRRVVERSADIFPWVLEHHSNLEPLQQTWHSKLASENWDAPIVLTTMVQFLEVLFSGGTRGVRRMHQLANSVLIFDEIQTVPVSCAHLFCNAVNYLADYCGTSAVMCTATQPVLDKLKATDKGQLRISNDKELVADVAQLFEDLKRIKLSNRVKPAGWTDDKIADLALSEFTEKGSCLIIVNTKAWAQKLYQALQPKVSVDEVFHLSTNLCPRHRKITFYLIKRRLRSNRPVLCISTQLIEAGVDIDFAAVIRFLAGLDSIAQAAGRCNRNGQLKNQYGEFIKGNVIVVNPQDEKIDRLQDIKIGRDNALRVLGEGFPDMLAPDAMQQYFNYYYYARSDDMSYTIPQKTLGRDDTLLNLLSVNDKNGGGTNPDIQHLLKQSFMTSGKIFKAIDAPTQAVIVPYGRKGRTLVADLCKVAIEFDSKHYRILLKRAQRYSVNIFPNVWSKLIEADAVHEIQPGEGVYFLDERHYSPEFGISLEPTNLMDAAIL